MPDKKYVPIVVDEEGRLMNYLKPIMQTGGTIPNPPRPFIYYCFTCDNCVAWEIRDTVTCAECGEPRLVREEVNSGHGKKILVWKK